MPSDRERYERAALWRQIVLPRMRETLRELRETRELCSDPSVERLQLSRAIEATAEAIRTCAHDLQVAQERMEADADSTTRDRHPSE